MKIILSFSIFLLSMNVYSYDVCINRPHLCETFKYFDSYESEDHKIEGKEIDFMYEEYFKDAVEEFVQKNYKLKIISPRSIFNYFLRYNITPELKDMKSVVKFIEFMNYRHNRRSYRLDIISFALLKNKFKNKYSK